MGKFVIVNRHARELKLKYMGKFVIVNRHAREPLYSTSAILVWWLQLKSAQIVYLAVKNGHILVNVFI